MILRQAGDQRPVLIIQLHLQRRQVGQLIVLTAGLGNHRHAVLVEQPFQRNLAGQCAVFGGDVADDLLFGDPATGERGIGRQRHAVLAGVVEQWLLV
ncbi:hypothetical protein D3C76_1461400 [compost metagenome]